MRVDPPHDEFGGLHRDLHALVDRRRALRVLGTFALGGIVSACTSGGQNEGAATTPTSSSGAATTAVETTVTGDDTSSLDDNESVAAGSAIPDETAGPFPADGTNGPDLLAVDGVVRADMTTSIGELSGTAEGVPMSFDLTVVDAATGKPVAGAALYLWHCTAGGRYSVYEVADQNYLRAIQATDDGGRLAFSSIFPGCYRGRWPHAHFEIFESLDAALDGAAALKTSQLALPEADSVTVYADRVYGESMSNLADLSLDSDNVFRDGWADQLAEMSGSPGEGYRASLLIRI